MNVPLRPLTAAFFVGRLATYTFYAAGVQAIKHTNFGRLLIDSLTSWWGIALQLLMLVGIVMLGRVDWTRFKPAEG